MIYFIELVKNGSTGHFSEFNSKDLAKFDLEDLFNTVVSFEPMEVLLSFCNTFKSILPSNMCKTDMGFYGLDTPLSLNKLFLNKVYSENYNIDAVMMNGDFVRHGMTDDKKPWLENWDKVRRTEANAIRTVRAKFPGMLILPTIGNNDVMNHY